MPIGQPKRKMIVCNTAHVLRSTWAFFHSLTSRSAGETTSAMIRTMQFSEENFQLFEKCKAVLNTPDDQLVLRDAFKVFLDLHRGKESKEDANDATTSADQGEQVQPNHQAQAGKHHKPKTH